MRLLNGKKIVSIDREGFEELRAGRTRVVIDVGTGDGRMAYRLARANPEWLVVGLDPGWQRMVDTAVRSRRKPERGGVPNMIFVASAIETAPEELTEVADEVLVLMPWGKLLRGLVLGEKDVCSGIRRVAKSSATFDLTVGTSIWQPPVPLEIQDLPPLTLEYVREELTPLWAEHGLRITEAQLLTGSEAAHLSTSWAKRLNSDEPEVVMHVRATALTGATAVTDGTVPTR